jgi:hypothetical protein
MKRTEVAKEIAVALGCCHCKDDQHLNRLVSSITYAQEGIEE